MGFLRSTDFITNATAAASTEETNFPASRLVTLARPFVRPWRSTNTMSTTITITLSGSPNVDWIMLYGANFSTVTVAGTPYIIEKHGWDMRRKLTIIRTGTMASIVIIIASQTPDNGVGYFQLGRVFAFGSYTELSRNPQAEMPFTLHDPQFINEGPGVYESHPAGPQYYSEEWSGIWDQSDEANVMDAVNVRGHEFMAVYKNLGRTYECDIRQRRGDESWQYGTTLLTGNPSFQQEP